MITKDCLKKAALLAIKRGATYIADDVFDAFERAIAIEDGAAANGLSRTLESLKISREKELPACPDTGWPLFFLKVGNEAMLEGGLLALEELIKDAVRECTTAGILRKTMKHPLTGYDPGDNVGENVPGFTYRFVPGNAVEITYAAKGGGSEVFGGTRHRMIAFSDGVNGIKQFIIDAFAASARAGAVCPPGILGVGIGGTANIAANLAKEAACLRKIGSHHPDPMFAELESQLCEGINSLGIGHMGAGGRTSVFAVHIEYAYTHIAGVAVATSTNCCVARRATVRAGENGIQLMDGAYWFDGR
ncbi:MAG: fumarate hydratase [Clostridia bacterium]|nr:fumarate hydratase [Clostridia bacterium]